MNIAFFLKPKHEVAFLYEHQSLRQGLEKLRQHGYSAIPVLTHESKYAGTVSEGDFLRYCKTNIEGAPNVNLNENVLMVPRAVSYDPVSINADMEDLISTMTNQNFVPVVDDSKKFIGIITRKDVIQYIYNKLKTNNLA